MKKILPCLFLIIMAFAACRKGDTNKKPVNQNGELTGTVTPAGAVEKVIIDTVVNGQKFFHESFPDEKGDFKFKEVHAGAYWLKFITKQDYYTPENHLINLEAGKSVSAGVISVNEKPDVGNLDAVVSPAGAAQFMTLTNIYNFQLTYNATFNAATGKYSFLNVPSGFYTLTAKPSPGFIDIEPKNYKITKHSTTDVGTLVFAEGDAISSISFYMNTRKMLYATYTANSNPKVKTSALYTAPVLVLKGTYASGSYQLGNSYRAEEFIIKLDDVTGPGTYVCKATATSEITYKDVFNSPLSMASTASSSKTGGSATVVITEIDAVNKIISGTFSGTLIYNGYPKVEARKIAEGIFKMHYQ